MHTNESDDVKSLHFAMYPWFAMGHIIPFLHLANKLAEIGHKISFFVPTKTQSKLTVHNHYPNLITFIPFEVPHVDGLPIGAETTSDVPLTSNLMLMEAMDLTQDTIDSHLAILKPDFIFFDYADWIPGLARKHGAKSIYNSVLYVIYMAFLSNMFRNARVSKGSKEALLMSPPADFPCADIRLHPHELRLLLKPVDPKLEEGKKLQERHGKCIMQCDVITSKTCREIEGAYIDYYKKHGTKPVIPVGPLLPKSQISKLDDRFDKWLSGFDHGTVVYCALGSEGVLEKEQFQELVLGLELTGRPFLAALRPPRGCETVEQGLPEGYPERIEGKGMVHGGWVQQQSILNHPSVGCFLTHCGPGSLSEAMLSECQLVLLPQAHDQFINARLMSLDLKVGVEVEKGEDDGLFTKEAICGAVAKVMEPESDVGREIRTNHDEVRGLLSRPGLEESYIRSFVQNLRELLV